MNHKLKLQNAVKYSDLRVNIKDITLDKYITTDNLLPNKQGVGIAVNLPPQIGNIQFFEPKNILVSNIRPYLKKIWFSDKYGGCSADVLVFVVQEDYIPKFIYYSMLRDAFFDHMVRGSKGTKMPRGDKNQILEFAIPNFSPKIQEKIAAVLSSLDDKIELNNRINSELENLAKTIYDYWFVQFDFPDENGKPYKSSGGKMVYNQELKREIPAGWEVKKLSYFCDKIGDGIHGTPKYVDISDYSFINGNNLNNGFIVIDNDTKKVSFDEYEKYFIELNDGTILLSINGTLGNLAIYTGEKVMLGKSAAYINCKTKYRPYCYQFFTLEHIQKKLWNIATGSTIKNLSLESLKNILIPFPGGNLIEKYYELTKLLDDKRINIFIQNQQLTQLRDWLLPMLMNGQITIK
ncbi:MAG: restriction endonuclease subunit S [Aphanizomenon gracile PMC638.10]|nr:restriction endonuclease subunit S [Aphanizomenon gracile PMC638.10]